MSYPIMCHTLANNYHVQLFPGLLICLILNNFNVIIYYIDKFRLNVYDVLLFSWIFYLLCFFSIVILEQNVQLNIAIFRSYQSFGRTIIKLQTRLVRPAE
jgi:hypothetical protein